MAGRLLTRLASTALTAAMPSRSGSEPPLGSTVRTAVARPWSLAAATIIPRPRTKTRKGGSTARTTPHGVVVRRTSAGTVMTAAPAVAIHRGWMPSGELARNPTRVAATTTRANRGSRAGSGGASRWRGRSSSAAKKHVRTTHSTAIAATVGSAISTAKRANDSPLARKAPKVVSSGSIGRSFVVGCVCRPARGARGRRSRGRGGSIP
jgi:hypothetical protein